MAGCVALQASCVGPILGGDNFKGLGMWGLPPSHELIEVAGGAFLSADIGLSCGRGGSACEASGCAAAGCWATVDSRIRTSNRTAVGKPTADTSHIFLWDEPGLVCISRLPGLNNHANEDRNCGISLATCRWNVEQFPRYATAVDSPCNATRVPWRGSRDKRAHQNGTLGELHTQLSCSGSGVILPENPCQARGTPAREMQQKS